MTELDRPDLHAAEWRDSAPASGDGAGRDLASLLDLHRRGVIDDAQFAHLSRSLTGKPATLPAVAAGSRGTTRRLARRSAAVVAGAAALVLAAAGVSLAVLPDADTRPVAVTASPETTTVRPEVAPSPSSLAAASPSSTPVPSDDLELEAERSAPAVSETAASSTSTRVALPAAPAPAPPAAAPVKPVAPPQLPAPAPVDCRAYAFEKEDNRIRYEAEAANLSISWNIALDTGDLDEAARLQSAADALQQRQALDDARLQALYPGC